MTSAKENPSPSLMVKSFAGLWFAWEEMEDTSDACGQLSKKNKLHSNHNFIWAIAVLADSEFHEYICITLVSHSWQSEIMHVEYFMNISYLLFTNTDDWGPGGKSGTGHLPVNFCLQKLRAWYSSGACTSVPIHSVNSKHQTLQVQQGIPNSLTRTVTNAFYDQFYPQIKLQIIIFPQTHVTKSCPLPHKQHLPQRFPQSFLLKEYKLREITIPGLKTAPRYFSLRLHLTNLYWIRAYSISVILINIFKSFLTKKRQLLQENCSLNYEIFKSRGRTVFR